MQKKKKKTKKRILFKRAENTNYVFKAFKSHGLTEQNNQARLETLNK